MKKYLTALILVMAPFTTQLASAADQKTPDASNRGMMSGKMGGGMAHGWTMDATQHEKMAAMHTQVAQCLKEGKAQADCGSIMAQAHKEMCAGKDAANCPAGMNMNMMGRSEVPMKPQAK